MKFYFAVFFLLMIEVGTSKALAQEATSPEKPPDVCSEAPIKELDLRFEKRSLSGSEGSPRKRYKEILEKRSDSFFRVEIAEKVRVLDEEFADNSFYVAMYYFDRYLRMGDAGGLRAARSRFQSIVEQAPQYSRVSDVKFWLGEATRALAVAQQQ